jgi:GT2 family glycosyltransferase
MGDAVRVGIVAPVHDRKELTLLCLRSIGRLERHGLDVFTVIVDDGSTDGTSEAIADDFPEVEVVAGDGNLWFTEGTNVGVRRALERGADFVLMINDDEVFDSRSLSFLVETALTHPRSVVGPLLLLWDFPHILFQTAPVWNALAGGWRHWFRQTVWTVPDSPFEVDIIVGNCLLVPAAAIKEVGLMNSKRYPNFGDAEYTPRLRKRGWRLLIDPRARVFCQPNTEPPKVSRMPLATRFRNLIVDPKHPQNLRRRFHAMWDGAPNRFSGMAAFVIFFLRVLAGRNLEGSYALGLEEKPLSETFRERIADK